MSKKINLINRFLSKPTNFHFDELGRLLNHFGFYEVTKGKTSGSRVRFINEEGVPIHMHKPHPSGIMSNIS